VIFTSEQSDWSMTATTPIEWQLKLKIDGAIPPCSHLFMVRSSTAEAQLYHSLISTCDRPKFSPIWGGGCKITFLSLISMAYIKGAIPSSSWSPCNVLIYKAVAMFRVNKTGGGCDLHSSSNWNDGSCVGCGSIQWEGIMWLRRFWQWDLTTHIVSCFMDKVWGASV
jgi:hypothetical protein